MKNVRLLHGAAASVSGLALAGAIYAPRLGVVCCVLATLIMIWSGEKLRHAFVTADRSRENRP